LTDFQKVLMYQFSGKSIQWERRAVPYRWMEKTQAGRHDKLRIVFCNFVTMP